MAGLELDHRFRRVRSVSRHGRAGAACQRQLMSHSRERRRTLDVGASHPVLSSAARVQLGVVIAILAWGVLTFGAVYPWGYQPLALACALCGTAALVVGRANAAVPRSVFLAFAAVVLAVLAQEITLPVDILRRVSPATVTLLSQYDLTFALTKGAAHALSIDPSRTWTGLSLLVSFGIFWLGLTTVLDDRLIRKVLLSVIVIGLIVSLSAIVFTGNHSGKVYGFWQPRSPGSPFGPFVNRNHYAGWMLMSTLAGFGYFGALLNDAMRARVRSWRERVIWLSTPEATRLIWVGIALIVMTLSVLLSMSRSGITCLALGFGAIGFVQGRKAFSGRMRAAFVCAVLVLGVASAAWAGVDTLATRFSAWQDDSLSGRVAVWRDARVLIGRFPLTGTGLNTFGVAMLFYQTTHLQELYAEAHNDYLQLAAEGGVLLVVPALVLVLFASRTAWRRLRDSAPGSTTSWIRTGAVIGLLAVALQDAGEFSLQMPGNAALFCVLAAIALHRSS